MTVRTRSGTESTNGTVPWVALAGVLLLGGCGSSNDVLLNSQPSFVAGVVQRATFDGSGNDLLIHSFPTRRSSVQAEVSDRKSVV